MPSESHEEHDPLWVGATVRWVGPPTDAGGVMLRPGDVGRVVDAGRHQLRSYGTGDSGVPQPLRVLVELPSGARVDLERVHLALVPPDHPLRAEPDAACAAWIFDALAPMDEPGVPLCVSAFVPRQFEAVVRVLHPWCDESQQAVRWSTVAKRAGYPTIDAFSSAQRYPLESVAGMYPTEEGEVDARTAEALIGVLRNATATPEDVTFAVWVGWGDIPPALFPGAAQVRQPIRDYFLLRGPIDGVLSPINTHRSDDTARAALWWPQDRSWVVATEIDFSWTFVAGSAELAKALLEREDLEVLLTSPDAPAVSFDA